MQILNYEELPHNPYTFAVFDLYHPTSTRTDFNMEVCKSKNGHFYVKFPDIKSKRNLPPKPYVRCGSYSTEKEKSFINTLLELLKPFLPQEATKQPRDEDAMPF